MSFWKGPPLHSMKGYAMCFACGKENPIGLKLHFHREGDTVSSEFVPGELHQGWPGIVHGGIINTLLDEAMCYVPYFQGLHCVTAKQEVRLRCPANVGERLFIRAWPLRQTRRLIETAAEITREDGTTMAEASATMYIVNDARRDTT